MGRAVHGKGNHCYGRNGHRRRRGGRETPERIRGWRRLVWNVYTRVHTRGPPVDRRRGMSRVRIAAGGGAVSVPAAASGPESRAATRPRYGLPERIDVHAPRHDGRRPRDCSTELDKQDTGNHRARVYFLIASSFLQNSYKMETARGRITSDNSGSEVLKLDHPSRPRSFPAAEGRGPAGDGHQYGTEPPRLVQEGSVSFISPSPLSASCIPPNHCGVYDSSSCLSILFSLGMDSR